MQFQDCLNIQLFSGKTSIIINIDRILKKEFD
jgi:hypothetical protein